MNAPTQEIGDADAFIAGYRATLPGVFAYLLRATGGDRAVAEDLASETFFAALTSWRTGNADAISPAWLTGVARHKLIDRLRRNEREERKLALVAASDNDGVDEELPTVDRLVLRGAIRKLPPLQRAVLALRYVDDLSIIDIANDLDRSVSAVDSLLRRARRQLRELLLEGDLS